MSAQIVSTTGNIDVPGTSTFASAVNNADGFLSFRPMNGSPSYIAKTAIRRIEQVDVPEADQISRRSLDAGDNFDPYAALGVEKDAGQGTVRSASNAAPPSPCGFRRPSTP